MTLADHLDVQDSGNIVTLRPISDPAREWVCKNVGQPAPDPGTGLRSSPDGIGRPAARARPRDRSAKLGSGCQLPAPAPRTGRLHRTGSKMPLQRRHANPNRFGNASVRPAARTSHLEHVPAFVRHLQSGPPTASLVRPDRLAEQIGLAMIGKTGHHRKKSPRGGGRVCEARNVQRLTPPPPHGVGPVRDHRPRDAGARRKARAIPQASHLSSRTAFSS
jgi:hypothetical protein